MPKTVKIDPQARLLFKDAFERFEKTVSPLDKRSFKSSTIQDVWTAALEVQKQMAARRAARDMKGLQAFLDGIQRYSVVVEVLCNGTPYLSWIWAPVKLTLEIANGHASAFDTIIEAYTTIAITLPRFDNLGNAFADNRDFQQVLPMVYADILELHRRIYKYTHRKGWQLLFDGLWSRFDVRFKGILESLAKHSDLADKEASALHIAEAKIWRDRSIADAEQQEHERAKKHLLNVLAWLDAADTEQDNEYDRLNEACHQGTCSWMRQNTKINTWMTSGRSHSVLWIEGKPGSGKSVLASKITQYLVNDAQHTVLFYICSYRFSSQNHALSILKRLCSQLLRKHTDLIPLVYDEYLARGLSPTLINLREALSTLLQSVQQVRIVIDGLDELDEKDHSNVLKLLLTFITMTGADVKMLVASRDVKHISKMLRRYTTLKLNDERQAIEAAIKSYVHFDIADLRTRFGHTYMGQTVVGEVEDRLVEKSDGMFLYVRLVLTSFNNVHSIKELQDTMNTLPEGLDEAYGRCLHAIERLTARDQDKAIRILEWVTYASLVAKRPVKKLEIQGGLAFATNDSEPSELMLLSSDIFDLCKPLVIDGPNNSLVFAHFSVQEYLIHKTSGPFLNGVKANYNIAVGCIRQLIHSVLLTAESVTERDRIVSVATGMHSLHLYADEHCYTHTLAFFNNGQETDQQRRLYMLDLLIELARVYSIPSYEAGRADLRSPLANFTTNPAVHRLFIAFANSRKIMSKTTSKIAEAGSIVFNPPPAQIMPWDLIRDQYNDCVRHLLSVSSLVGFTDEELHRFQALYASTAYTCRIRPCIRATDGFSTPEDRNKHELLHTARLQCDEPGCAYPGFGNARALQLHKDNCHGELGSRKWKGELPISIRQKKRLELEQRSKVEEAALTSEAYGALPNKAVADDEDYEGYSDARPPYVPVGKPINIKFPIPRFLSLKDPDAIVSPIDPRKATISSTQGFDYTKTGSLIGFIRKRKVLSNDVQAFEEEMDDLQDLPLDRPPIPPLPEHTDTSIYLSPASFVPFSRNHEDDIEKDPMHTTPIPATSRSKSSGLILASPSPVNIPWGEDYRYNEDEEMETLSYTLTNEDESKNEGESGSEGGSESKVEDNEARYLAWLVEQFDS